jgi:hypothetical protein
LTLAEFQALQSEMRPHGRPLRAVLSALRAARRRAAAAPAFADDVLAELDDLIAKVERVQHAARRVGSLVGLRRIGAFPMRTP